MTHRAAIGVETGDTEEQIDCMSAAATYSRRFATTVPLGSLTSTKITGKVR